MGSQTPPNRFSRKTSESLGFGFSNGGCGSSSHSAPDSRRGSTSSNSKQDVDRRPSSDLNAEELTARRMSEAGLRRPSAASDEILNENTGNLMVGMPVWVDGTKHGRIAYIGEVHFAKGEMAGVHWIHPRAKIMELLVESCTSSVSLVEVFFSR